MFSIRNATTDDIALIRELSFKIWPQTYAAIISKEQIDYMMKLMYSKTSLQKQMMQGSQFIIAYDNEEPVGFAAYQETAPAVFKLLKIYVLLSQQGKGTGKFIIAHIVEKIKSKNAEALQLQVNRNNNARFFYEKLGFQILKEINLDIGNGFFMNDYVMQLSLGPEAKKKNFEKLNGE
ncbi:MAG: GNAT family N-acetyltransferase [Bacteroidetes bacterium]|nr:GNAT family N-acetyltransferase [Bacteroidota bacterium]MBS1931157.1 GNAT family N-acetyltransferase [Bacteroidota bacterium]